MFKYTSQEVFSLIWRHSTAPPTSPAYITLRWPLWCSTPPPRKTFKWNSLDSRQLRYRCCDSLLCTAPLLMVYNVTPRYHGCSNCSTVDHSTSIRDLQRHFTIAKETFSRNIFAQKTIQARKWMLVRKHRVRLFCVGCTQQVRHTTYKVWFGASVQQWWLLPPFFPFVAVLFAK